MKIHKRILLKNFLKCSGILWGLREFSGNQTLRILMYHRVFDKGADFPYFLDGVPSAEFERQMEFLSKHFSVIALEEAIDHIESGKALPKRAVAITIDDGYKDCYENIYPALRKYGLPATMYLTTKNISSSNAFWADKLGYLFKKGIPLNKSYEHNLLGGIEVDSPENRMSSLNRTIKKLKTLNEIDKNNSIDDLKDFFQIKDDKLCADYNLSWSEVKKMSNNGIFFGAHTVTHPILTRVNIETAESEIRESKRRIEDELGKEICGFCYPNGTEADFNNTIVNLLKKYGFKYAITTIWGFNNAETDLFRLKRVGPNPEDDLDRFECIVSGGFEAANKLRKIIGVKKYQWNLS